LEIVVISDTHNLHKYLELPDGDMIIHAGDFCTWGKPQEAMVFKQWFSQLPYKYKVCIAGNHDRCMESIPALALDFKSAGIYYLLDDEVVIEDIKIYGSPYTPEFGPFAFMYKRGNRSWHVIPDDTDILVTHGPPYGILDLCPDGFVAGCKDLLQRISELKDLKYHIFGHIHEGYGIEGKHINASNHPLLWKKSGGPDIDPRFADKEYKPIIVEI